MLCLCLSQEWHFTLNPKYIFLITDYVFIVFRNIDTSKMYHQNKDFNMFNHCSSFHVITIWVLHLITIWAGWNYYNSRQFCVTIQVGQLLQFKASLITIHGRIWRYYNSGQFLLQFRASITIWVDYYNSGLYRPEYHTPIFTDFATFITCIYISTDLYILCSCTIISML